MKRFVTILPLAAAVLCMAACNSHKEQDLLLNEPQGTHIVVNEAANWNRFRLPAYIGDLSAYPEDMQTAIDKLFPVRGEISSVKVAFISPADAGSPALAEAVENGAFIVYPGDMDVTSIGIAPVIATFEGGSKYKPLFHCHSSWGLGITYTMWEEPEVEPFEDIEPSMSESQWIELQKKCLTLGEESGYVMSDYDNEPDFNLNYYYTRLDAFVTWLEKTCMEQTLTKATSYEDLKANIEQAGLPLHQNFPYSLNKTIDKGTWCDPDVLSKSGSIDVEFRVFPCYMQSSNGDNAGDYYSVVSTITPHNASMWGPFVGSHGGCRNRVYGYWFNTMDVETSLVNTDGSPIPGLSYFDRPIPENKNSSKQYSNGHSISVTGSVSGGYGGKSAGGVINAGLSVGGTWTSSTNYTLETIDYSLDSSTPSVKYHYWSNNVKLTDDYDNWDKINNEDFPAPVRTEFSAHTMWTWHIPGSTVGDNDTKSFKLKTKVKLSYSSWYHWRGSVEYDSNRKDYDIDFSEFSWEIKAPNRIPWGFINLRNASSNEMSHVSYYVSGHENEDPVATLTSSYGKGDEARIALAEGTYSIRWDVINGDTQEKLGSYIYRNVKVHQGRNAEEATISISSVDGEREE